MMIIPILILFSHAVWSAPTELKDCEYCNRHAARCAAGQAVRSRRVQCACSPERLYQCQPLAALPDHEPQNIISEKPTKARCEPKMIYVLDTVTCMCSKSGSWPHDKCEDTFGNLYKEPTITKLRATKNKLHSHSKIKKVVSPNYYVNKILATNYEPSVNPSQSEHNELDAGEGGSMGPEHTKLHNTKSHTGSANDVVEVNDGHVEREESCEPNTYVIRGCNVCRCGPQGVIERCTKNVCDEEQGRRTVVRRTYDSVHGSCVPQNWYALSPCQFCYCQQSNKLVCSTHYKDYNSLLALGAYNLTDCGRDLIKELYELGPEYVNSSSITLREGGVNLSTQQQPQPTPKATTMRVPAFLRTTIKSSPRPYDANLQVSLHLKKPNEDVSKVEYESESEEETATEALRVGIQPVGNTLSPFENEEEEEEEDNANLNTYVRLPDGSFKPTGNRQESASLKIPTPQPSILNAMMTAQGMPKEMVQILASMPEVSQMHSPLLEPQVPAAVPDTVHNYDVSIQAAKPNEKPESNVLRINLPSMVERIIKLALRKSMVKIDSSQSCMPGTTSQDGCNFCYCLTNGKLLCTDKKTC